VFSLPLAARGDDVRGRCTQGGRGTPLQKFHGPYSRLRGNDKNNFVVFVKKDAPAARPYLIVPGSQGIPACAGMTAFFWARAGMTVLYPFFFIIPSFFIPFFFLLSFSFLSGGDCDIINSEKRWKGNVRT
jgi:hypothetical protein